MVAFNFDRTIKAKDFNIKIESNHLKIEDKIEKKIVVDGDLYDSIKVDESLWTIEE